MLMWQLIVFSLLNKQNIKLGYQKNTANGGKTKQNSKKSFFVRTCAIRESTGVDKGINHYFAKFNTCIKITVWCISRNFANKL